jgi:hypothetical protein
VTDLKGVGTGVSVSFGILAAAVLSVLYSLYIPDAVRVATDHFDIHLESVWTILVVLIFSNIGTYAFTSEIPSYLLRERHALIRSLAHVLSSSVAFAFGYLVFQDMEKPFPIPPGFLDSPLVAGLYLIFPIIIILFAGLRASKGEKSDPGQT